MGDNTLERMQSLAESLGSVKSEYVVFDATEIANQEESTSDSKVDDVQLSSDENIDESSDKISSNSGTISEEPKTLKKVDRQYDIKLPDTEIAFAEYEQEPVIIEMSTLDNNEARVSLAIQQGKQMRKNSRYSGSLRSLVSKHLSRTTNRSLENQSPSEVSSGSKVFWSATSKGVERAPVMPNPGPVIPGSFRFSSDTAVHSTNEEKVKTGVRNSTGRVKSWHPQVEAYGSNSINSGLSSSRESTFTQVSHLPPPPPVRMSDAPPDPNDAERDLQFEQMVYQQTGKRGKEVWKEMKTIARRLGRRHSIQAKSIDVQYEI